MRSPWVQPWPLVRDLYARLRAQQDKVRALAALAGIRTGYAHLRPDDTRAWANVLGDKVPRLK